MCKYPALGECWFQTAIAHRTSALARILVFVALGSFQTAVASEAGPLATSTKPLSTYAIAASEDKPFHWGEALVIAVDGNKDLDLSDAGKWTATFNGVPVTVKRVFPGAANTYRLIVLPPPPSASGQAGLDAYAMGALAPARFETNRVQVGLTYKDATLTAVADQNLIWLRLIDPWHGWLFLVGALLLLAGLIYTAAKTGVLRDSDPSLSPMQRPFSLARTQLAFWFVLVVMGYGLLYLLTGQICGVFNATALVLIGVSTATTVAASAVTPPASKPLVATPLPALVANAEPANPALLVVAVPSQVHQDFFTDLLSDANGANLHRLQMVVWTILFGSIFVFETWSKLSFPDFDEKTYFLMGLSSTTYVWFKQKES